MTASVLKKISKTHKRLKERFLIRQNRTNYFYYTHDHALFFFASGSLVPFSSRQPLSIKLTPDKCVFCCMVVRSLKKRASSKISRFVLFRLIKKRSFNLLRVLDITSKSFGRVFPHTKLNHLYRRLDISVIVLNGLKLG